VACRFLGLPLALVFLACGPALHPLPEHPESDASVLLSRAEARSAGLRGLSGAGRAESRTPDGTMRGRVTILADLSGRLRVDAWTPTDDLVGAVSAGPDGFTYFQRGGACYVGGSCAANLGLVLPKGWDLDSILKGLLGIPPMRAANGPWSLAFDRRVGAYRLESAIGGGVQRLWVREDGATVRYERDRDGRLEIRLVVEEPGEAAGVPARKVRLGTGRGDSEMAVRYSDREPNPEVAGEDWPVECPDGMVARFLPCEGEP